MADIAKLESELLSAVEKASDEAALETIRVSALGKSGSVSALLKTLGAMTPDERKSKGPAINGLKDTMLKAMRADRRDLSRRMRTMRRYLKDHDVERWAREFLADLDSRPEPAS